MKKCLEICCLKQDFDDFPLKDETLIEENNNCLSSGQKVRVNLARGIYSDADIYLIENIFNYFDNFTRNKVFYNLVNFLKGKKTAIIVIDQKKFPTCF